MPWIVPAAPATIAALTMLAALTSCAPRTDFVATEGAGSALKAACAAFEPIGWSRADTDDTIRAVKAHNAAYLAICRRS